MALPFFSFFLALFPDFYLFWPPPLSWMSAAPSPLSSGEASLKSFDENRFLQIHQKTQLWLYIFIHCGFLSVLLLVSGVWFLNEIWSLWGLGGRQVQKCHCSNITWSGFLSFWGRLCSCYFKRKLYWICANERSEYADFTLSEECIWWLRDWICGVFDAGEPTVLQTGSTVWF